MKKSTKSQAQELTPNDVIALKKLKGDPNLGMKKQYFAVQLNGEYIAYGDTSEEALEAAAQLLANRVANMTLEMEKFNTAQKAARVLLGLEANS
jgi:hypothetical protein